MVADVFVLLKVRKAKHFGQKYFIWVKFKKFCFYL